MFNFIKPSWWKPGPVEPAIYQSSGHDSDIDPQLQATRPLDSGKEISLSTERPIEAYVYTDTTISRPAPSSSRVEATSMEKTDREGALSEIPPNLYIHRVESVLHELLAKMPRKLAREEQFSDTERHSKYLLYTLLQCQHLVLDQAVVDRGAAMAITSQERQKARGGICVDCMDAVGKKQLEELEQHNLRLQQDGGRLVPEGGKTCTHQPPTSGRSRAPHGARKKRQPRGSPKPLADWNTASDELCVLGQGPRSGQRQEEKKHGAVPEKLSDAPSSPAIQCSRAVNRAVAQAKSVRKAEAEIPTQAANSINSYTPVTGTVTGKHESSPARRDAKTKPTITTDKSHQAKVDQVNSDLQKLQVDIKSLIRDVPLTPPVVYHIPRPSDPVPSTHEEWVQEQLKFMDYIVTATDECKGKDVFTTRQNIARQFMEIIVRPQRSCPELIARWCEVIAVPHVFRHLCTVIPELLFDENANVSNPLVKRMIQGTAPLRTHKPQQHNQGLSTDNRQPARKRAKPELLWTTCCSFESDFNIKPFELDIPTILPKATIAPLIESYSAKLDQASSSNTQAEVTSSSVQASHLRNYHSLRMAPEPSHEFSILRPKGWEDYALDFWARDTPPLCNIIPAEVSSQFLGESESAPSQPPRPLSPTSFRMMLFAKYVGALIDETLPSRKDGVSEASLQPAVEKLKANRAAEKTKNGKSVPTARANRVGIAGVPYWTQVEYEKGDMDKEEAERWGTEVGKIVGETRYKKYQPELARRRQIDKP